MVDRVDIDNVVLFYADGSAGTEKYTPEYLRSCEEGTRRVHEAGGSTHVVPRHPWDPQATDADWDAWLEGKSRGRVERARFEAIPCESLGLDPDQIADTHRLTANGKPAVPGWVGDLRGLEPSFLDEIKEGIRPNFSAGFRDAKAGRWHGIDLPYCDHFAAFGHIDAHCPPLSKQRHQFSSHQVAHGAGRSVQWFSEELHTMSGDLKTLAELAKGLTREELQQQLKEARKSDLFQEVADEMAEGDDDGEESELTIDQVKAAIQKWPAADVASFAAFFTEFQNSLMGVGGETFSAAELEAMPEKVRNALKAEAAERQKNSDRLGVLEADKRAALGDTFAEKLIEETPLKGIPSLHAPVRELCSTIAKSSGKDTFSASDSLVAKQLLAVADELPDFGGEPVPGHRNKGRDTFDEEAAGREYDEQQDKLGWKKDDNARKAHIARKKKEAGV